MCTVLSLKVRFYDLTQLIISHTLQCGQIENLMPSSLLLTLLHSTWNALLLGKDF